MSAMKYSAHDNSEVNYFAWLLVKCTVNQAKPRKTLHTWSSEKFTRAV